jgi:Spy/CpxP family protein refolding chaperone
MLRKFVAATTAAMMCTTAGTCAFAQDSEGYEGKHHMGGPGHRMHHEGFGDPAHMLEMMTRHLDLDDAQVQTISNIFESAKPEIDALRERGKAARKAMHELDVSDAEYHAKLNNLSVEIGTLTSEATLLHGRLRAEVFAQLTPEQRERAAAGRNRMHERFGHWGFGRWHDPDEESSE